MAELIQCSKCRSRKLPSFFATKATTGKMFKTCDSCRTRTKDVCCPQCPFTCATPSHLKPHIKSVHDKIKDHQCPHCEMAFSEVNTRTTHIKAVHEKIKDFQCPECESVFFLEYNLVDHIKAVHNKIKDQQCRHCDAVFSTIQALKAHVKAVHDKIKEHECPECHLQVVTAGHLRRHMATCTGEIRMSGGEFSIKGVLDAMEIKYEQQMRFLDCKNINPLPFDFYLPHQVTAIEFDGRQHFEPVEAWGGQEQLEQTQRNDAIKNAYCVTNNIRLLRIKYTDFERIPELIRAFLSV